MYTNRRCVSSLTQLDLTSITSLLCLMLAQLKPIDGTASCVAECGHLLVCAASSACCEDNQCWCLRCSVAGCRW
jgi:hypothetical protein